MTLPEPLSGADDVLAYIDEMDYTLAVREFKLGSSSMVVCVQSNWFSRDLTYRALILHWQAIHLAAQWTLLSASRCRPAQASVVSPASVGTTCDLPH